MKVLDAIKWLQQNAYLGQELVILIEGQEYEPAFQLDLVDNRIYIVEEL